MNSHHITEELREAINFADYVLSSRETEGYTLLLRNNLSDRCIQKLIKLECRVRVCSYFPDSFKDKNIYAPVHDTSPVTMFYFMEELAKVLEKQVMGCYYINVPENLVHPMSKDDLAPLLAPDLPTQGTVLSEIDRSATPIKSTKDVSELLKLAFDDIPVVLYMYVAKQIPVAYVMRTSPELSKKMIESHGKYKPEEKYTPLTENRMEDDVSLPSAQFMYTITDPFGYGTLRYEPMYPNQFIFTVEQVKEIISDRTAAYSGTSDGNSYPREHQAQS